MKNPNQNLQKKAYESFYTGKVMDHFLQPRYTGRLEKYDAVGEVGNIVCGDVMRIYLKIEKNKKKEPSIANISFETYGCGAAIATSSLACELALGKTLKQALKIEKKDIVEGLEYLPPQKIHCSILAVDALREAIYNYLTQQKEPIPQDLEKFHQQMVKQKEILQKQYETWMKK